jgi:valyl-tRNA synthetase
MTDIPKTYEPAAIESKWYADWEAKGCFAADPASEKPAYSIVIPPPNVTGHLTLGHVLNNTIQDILARRARMLGKEVLWLPGTDHAGIATQNVVEKTLRKEGAMKHRDDLGREALVGKIWEWKEKYGGIILKQLRALGASCDWSRTRFTMDPEYSACVQRVFVDLYKKGLIYRGKRMVNWCPASLTALSDEEVVMKEQNGFMYHFRVEVVEDPGTFLTIATTRPETIPADTAVAVNPNDPRYTHLIGKHVWRALGERVQIPIIADDHVTFDFGTGVLKVTPAHDKADYEIGLRHKLPVIDVLTPDGKMTDLAGAELAGMERFAARKKSAELLEAAGALEKTEPYKNNVGYSERADVPIEPRLSEQWFLKYPSVEASKACVEQTELLTKKVEIVTVRGDEIAGNNIKELRKSALAYARTHGFLGKRFINEDTGREIRAGRESLSHSFGNLGVANILAVAALPELIRTAIWVSSAAHEPRTPQFIKVHRFVAAAMIRGEMHAVYITAKEAVDGTIYYDHRVQKKVAPGGKSLEAHPRKEKLDTQPAPNATSVFVRELLETVNPSLIGRMRFYPPRWAKVYDHWMTGIQDWCISRQLWWGHRVPVWTKSFEDHIASVLDSDAVDTLTRNRKDFVVRRDPEIRCAEDNDKPCRIYVCVSPDSSADSNQQNIIRQIEELGFTQDPDVLDTWFSSWLWPFATMGWPDKTNTLAKFYPTTDLVTGPDIIFFWVARMIMAGYEWMGDLPFKNVYFTGIIRDKQGRKLSKSLGNSPDPLDLIAKYGADALRFGTMRSAPLGTDVIYDEKNVELGRNFCTKLWNAARFRQMHGGETEGEIRPDLLTSDDKWILARLNDAIREVSTALDEYRFSDASGALYRFFWSEYCDWYVEASKATLYGTDEARKANTLAVMDFVFSHTLRLFHPYLPFITEELWNSMGFANDLPAKQGGDTIMFAVWPKPFTSEECAYFGLDETSDALAKAKYATVEAGRGLRRDFNLPGNKKNRFILKPSGALEAHEANVIANLLNAEPFEVDAAFTPTKGTPVALTPLGELFLPLEGLIDVAAERERIGKEITKVEGELEKVRAKLADENFAAKVPAKVLEEHRQRELDWAEKHAQLVKMRDALGVS